MDLTLVDGSVLQRPVPAIQYSATKDGGLQAQVKIAQKSAAGATALKDIIKDQTTAAIRTQSLSLLGDHYVSQYRRPAQVSLASLDLEALKRRIKVSARASTYYAEVAFAPGPPGEGVTGNNDVNTMYGSSLATWCSGTTTL